MKCQEMFKSCLPSSKFEYNNIEDEMASNRSWPPVSKTSVDLAKMFQRLDSANHVPRDVSSVPSENLKELIESDDDAESHVSVSEVVPEGIDESTLTQKELHAQNGEQFAVGSDKQGLINEGYVHTETAVDEMGKYTTSL